MKKSLLYSFFITAMLCIVGINNAWADVTYTLSSGTLTFSYSGSGSSAMTDYVDFDGSGSPKRPAAWTFSVTHVVINEGVTSIGTHAFQGCSSLQDITIPTSVTTCKTGAFTGCEAMTKIYYAGSPNQWAVIDFADETAHPFGALNTTADYYFYGDKSNRTNTLVFFPPLTEIKKYTFYRIFLYGSSNGLSIPGTVASIGNYAFYGCNIQGPIAINRKESPTMGTDAFRGVGTKRTLYVPSGATGYRTSGSNWYFTLSSQAVSGNTLNSYGSGITWKLREDGVLILDASNTETKSITFDAASTSTYPWYYFRRLVHKIILKGEISSLYRTLRYHFGISEVILQQQTVPSHDGTYVGGTSYASLLDKSGTKLTLRIPPELEGNAGLSSAPWNDATHWNVVVTDYCADPSDLTEGTITATSATFTWTADRGSTWKYLCKTLGSAEPTSSEWESAPSTSSKSGTATGLNPATSYTFYLMADCGSAGTSEVLSADFTTECAVISSSSIPWSEGFESGTNNQIPLCWKQALSNANGWLQVRNSDQYAGSKAAHLFGGRTDVSVITAVFPEFEDDIKDLAVSFYYKTSVNDDWSTYGQPQLGYITDPEDASTFEAVGEALDQTSSYEQVENFTVPTNITDGARFAIRYAGGSDNGYVYIDDIIVTEKPTCNKPTGVAVTADSETAEGATITWNANGMSAWVMQVSEGDASSWGDDINVVTNSKVLTGLKAHTTYYIHVKATCGVLGDSEWSDNVSFTTLCGTASVSASSAWNNDFEGLGDHVIPECWDNTASTTSSSWGSGYIWGTYERNSNKSLAIDNSVCDGGTALINTPDIAIPNDGREYELTFDYSNMAIAGSNLYVKISANGGDFDDKGTYYPSGNVSSYPGDFTTATISLADYSNKTIKVQFFANPTSGTASSGGAMFIDNVSVHKVPTCFQPTELAASNLSSSSAHMTWTAGGSETAWRLQYRTDGGSWSAEQSVITNAQYDITGLSANTEYFVRVKAYCGVEDESEWSEVASFTTLCAAASMPFSEEFSQEFALPSCWEASPATGTYRWYANSPSYGHYDVMLRTGSSGNAELKMPPVSLSEDAILRFEWKNVSGAQVNVYISTNGGSSRTMLPNDLGNVHSDWTTKVIDLSAYTGQTALIYFVANFETVNQYAYLDDVEVVARPCEMILSIAAAPITGGATLSWSGSAKKIRYKKGSDEWSYATPANNAGPHTLTGLTPATTYRFCLLPTCLEEEEANWTEAVLFTTKTTEAIPYSNDFESETPGDVPFNWSRISASEYPQVSHDSYAYRDGGSFGDQGNSVKFYGVNDQILVFPEFDADLGDLIVSFHYRNRDCTMQLGYIEEDGTTFVALETLSNQTGYGEYPFEKDLYGISGDAKNLAIRYSNAGGTAQAWVDNVEVKEATCGQPTGLAFDNVTANSAHISWSASARGGESNYQYIRQAWSEDDPNWASATLIGSDVTELNITGLNANTRYEFYLRSYCGVSDQSTPVKVEFTTLMKDEVFEDLASATNNETRLAALEGQTINMTIKRPLLLNGDYCTLCLPFNLSASEIANPECPLHGFVIKEFEMSQATSGAVNIYLNQVTSIEAGKAYFVRYAGEPSEDRLTPMTFRSVTITASTPAEVDVDDDCTPHGVFNPYPLTGGDETTLFLSSNNTLYYPSANGTMNGFRAYIKVGDALSAPIRRGAPIRIVEKENSATGLDQITNDKSPMTNKILRDGQIIIIRDGKEYNIMGIMVK